MGGLIEIHELDGRTRVADGNLGKFTEPGVCVGGVEIQEQPEREGSPFQLIL